MRFFLNKDNDGRRQSPGQIPEGEALLAGLNPEQREAATATEGYVRVIAGAGSGKTKTLAHRFAYLVNEVGISPSNILCVTFTNKAAQEMKNRVRQYVDMGDINDFICTYHGFCVKVLREDISKIAYPAGFVIMDEEDRKAILREIYEELGLKQTELTFDKALEFIAYRKYNSPYIAEFIDIDTSAPLEAPSPDSAVMHRCFVRYVQKQRKGFMLDFDDLMLFAMYIFEKSPEVLEKWQRRLDYIMVDETQDNSAMQWKFVEMLQRVHRNLFVVGDPDQCIYEWRGARPETLVNFEKDFSPCRTIILDRNYRSTPNILDVANSVIANNRNRVPKELFTKKPSLAAVTHFHGKNEAEEGRFIASTIAAHIAAGGSAADVAVLFRASHLSRFIEQALVKAKIPYVVYGGVRFFERREIKDVLAYLRMVDSADDLSFNRVVNQPSRKLGKVFLGRLKAVAEAEQTTLYRALKRHIGEKEFSKTGALEFVELIESAREAFAEMTLSDATQFILERSGLMQLYRTDGDQDRVDNLNELIASMRDYEKDNANEENLTLGRYLQDIALYTNIDYRSALADSVKIMTIHQSKGLEFPVVIVAGMTEGVFPNHRSLREFKRRGLEEERRLAYVAFTRAENSLYLTESEGMNFNSGGSKLPSRFIFEIKKRLLVRRGVLGKDIEQQALRFIENSNREIEGAETREQSSLAGKPVRHKIFGEGVVTAVDNDTLTIEILFPSTGATKHFALNQIGRSLTLL